MFIGVFGKERFAVLISGVDNNLFGGVPVISIKEEKNVNK